MAKKKETASQAPVAGTLLLVNVFFFSNLIVSASCMLVLELSIAKARFLRISPRFFPLLHSVTAGPKQIVLSSVLAPSLTSAYLSPSVLIHLQFYV